MSLDIWPPLAPDALKTAIETTQDRELEWLLEELREVLENIKLGLEECYALLAPTEPGSTLVVSTPRNELVKGHVTRVGTHIVKGTIHLRLRTLSHMTVSLNPDNPITLAPLETLHTLLIYSIDLLTLTLSYCHPSPPSPPRESPDGHHHHASPLPAHLGGATFMAAQLRLLAQSLAEASAVLKGPPLSEADPAWTTRSAAPAHFTPPLPAGLSFHMGVQDSQLVLWLRALEPAGAPVNLGMKFALAIGTARRLEHDEADQVFPFCCEDGTANGLQPVEAKGGTGTGSGGGGSGGSSGSASSGEAGNGGAPTGPVDVCVREKVRVESADPSLLSLGAKLSALSNTLSLARRNLAAVMGEELDE